MILIQSKWASSTASQECQNNTPSEILIDKFTARNNDTSGQTLTVWVVPSGGAVDDSNKRLTVTINTLQNYLCAELVGECLGPSDSVWVQSSAVNTISIRASGRLRTA